MFKVVYSSTLLYIDVIWIYKNHVGPVYLTLLYHMKLLYQFDHHAENERDEQLSSSSSVATKISVSLSDFRT